MSAIVLDSGPLGILCHPRNPPHVAACRNWLAALQAAGRRVVLPEMADYEIRRELIRANSVVALNNLDLLTHTLEYLPLNTVAMRLAADLWAQSRNIGRPTSPDPAIDGDVIVAAQAITLGVPAIVATLNIAHIVRFVPADLWSNITP